MRLGVALAALGAFIALAYWFMLAPSREDVISVAPKALPASQPTVAAGLRLQEGRATQRDAQGAEAPLAIGDALVGEVRTDAEGSALFTGEGASIRLGPDTQLLLRQRGERGYEFFLAGGSLEASSDGPRLEFFGAGTTGFVRVENGAARLLADGAHGLVVGSERGNVLVSNAGKELLVPSGQATRLLAEKPPDALWKLPASMLLKVSWPKDNELAVRKMRVTGTAAPGTLVRAQREKVLVDGQGRFTLDLPLSEGINTVSVRADDLAGRSEQSKFKVKVDTTPAEVGVETSPDMWKRR